MGFRHAFRHVIIATALLSLAACGQGNSNGNGQSGPLEQTSIGFRLSSFDQSVLGGGSTTTASQPLAATVQIDGELLVVPHDGTAENVLSFGLTIDPSKVQVLTVKNLGLEAGAYDFYFLLKTPTTRFGGFLRNRLVLSGGTNTVTLTLSPIVGVQVDSVTQFRDLAPFAVRYDPAVVGAYANPRFGVSINGGTEHLFDIFVDANNPVILLFLEPGDYQLSVRFFDGAIVRDVPVDDTISLAPPSDTGGGTVPEFQLVPLTAEATYSFSGPSPTAPGSATFNFTIPVDVVNEVGGPDTPSNPLSSRLKAVVSIVGDQNTLQEQVVTLTPVTDSAGNILHYSAQVVLDPFVQGQITWQLRFVDLTSGAEFAYCALNSDTANTQTPNQGSFVCNLNLLVQALSQQFPTGSVQVTVNDVVGLVDGAVVLINGKPVGITGSGTAGQSLGELLAFLPPGTYSLQVVQRIVDPYGSGKTLSRSSDPQDVTITANAITTVPITLPNFPFGAPQVLGTAPVDGATDVPVDTTLSVTFSHPMDHASTEAAISLATSGGTDVPRSYGWSAGDTVLTVTPAAMLAYQTPYSLGIANSAQDIYGKTLAGNRSAAFTTGTQPDVTPPQVTGVTPPAGAGNVDVSQGVIVTFSEAVQTATAESAFSLSSGGTAVSGSFGWSGDNTALTFTPDANLGYSTAYTVKVAAGVKDLVGNAMAQDFTSTFTTGLQPDTTPPTVVSITPADGATGVPVGDQIVVQFSEPMNQSSVEGAFDVSPNPGGSYKWLDTSTVAFVPATTLAYNTQYVVTIGPNAQDASLNAMGAQVQIGFRTAQAPPSATTITLEASRTVRPRSYDDALYPLTQPVTVRIPSLDEVQVEMDADGNTLGDPNRFLLVLSLGRVKCMYLGGKWDRHLGGVLEDIFKDAFQTPVCTHGHLRAGDTVTLEPGQYSPDVGPIHDDDDGGGPPSGDHAEIAARVITGNPFYPVTRVRVTLDVVPPTAP